MSTALHESAPQTPDYLPSLQTQIADSLDVLDATVVSGKTVEELNQQFTPEQIDFALTLAKDVQTSESISSSGAPVVRYEHVATNEDGAVIRTELVPGYAEKLIEMKRRILGTEAIQDAQAAEVAALAAADQKAAEAAEAARQAAAASVVPPAKSATSSSTNVRTPRSAHSPKTGTTSSAQSTAQSNTNQPSSSGSTSPTKPGAKTRSVQSANPKTATPGTAQGRQSSTGTTSGQPAKANANPATTGHNANRTPNNNPLDIDELLKRRAELDRQIAEAKKAAARDEENVRPKDTTPEMWDKLDNDTKALWADNLLPEASKARLTELVMFKPGKAARNLDAHNAFVKQSERQIVAGVKQLYVESGVTTREQANSVRDNADQIRNGAVVREFRADEAKHMAEKYKAQGLTESTVYDVSNEDLWKMMKAHSPELFDPKPKEDTKTENIKPFRWSEEDSIPEIQKKKRAKRTRKFGKFLLTSLAASGSAASGLPISREAVVPPEVVATAEASDDEEV